DVPPARNRRSAAASCLTLRLRYSIKAQTVLPLLSSWESQPHLVLIASTISRPRPLSSVSSTPPVGAGGERLGSCTPLSSPGRAEDSHRTTRRNRAGDHQALLPLGIH